MLQDYEQDLTTAGGQIFNPGNGSSEYGSIPFDLMVAGRDPTAGDPIYAVFTVVDGDVNNLTDYDFEIVSDDDGAGTNEVSLAKLEDVLLANLTEGSAHVVGPLAMAKVASTNQYLVAKVTQNGSNPTTGKITAQLHVGSDVVPFNDAFPG